MRTHLLISFLAILSLSACSGNRPQQLLNGDGTFVECPTSPNCVSSDSTSEQHQVAAFTINPDAADLWQSVKVVVATLPRTTLAVDQAQYLHAECRSALMGYVDDLQLQLRPDQGIIAVYSASRLGHSDFGVNRERVEHLRSLLSQQQLIL